MKKILLGSSSEMRKMIMNSSLYDFDILVPDIDETLYEHLVPIQKVRKIALEKNKKLASLQDIHKDTIIITADTLCLLPNGKTLQKPKNLEESIYMALEQNGRMIRAITGLCISHERENKRIFTTHSSTTRITYGNFTEEEIRTFMQKFPTTDKASGLGIWNDAPGFSLIKKWNGSYTGALGLPMEIVREIFTKIDYE